MNLIQSINTYLWLWQETLKSFRRPAVLLPFLAFALIEAALLVSSSWFHLKPWGYLWVPLLSWYPGRGSLHYPGYYLTVPQFTARLDLVLGVFLGCVTTGWGMLALRDTFLLKPGSLKSSWRAAAARYGGLLLVAALAALLTLAITAVNQALPREWFVGYAHRIAALRWTYYVVNILLQAALLYVPASMLLLGRSFKEAMGEGVGFFWRNRMMSFFLVVLPFVVTLPLSRVLENPVLLATRFRPEMALQLSVASVLLAALATLLLTGVSLRFFLYRLRLDRPAAAREVA